MVETFIHFQIVMVMIMMMMMMMMIVIIIIIIIICEFESRHIDIICCMDKVC